MKHVSEYVDGAVYELKKEAIVAWLKARGFDGLFVPGECACEVDDLCPCEETPKECEPGYFQEAPEGITDGSAYDCEFFIGRKKTGKTRDGGTDEG